MVPDGLACHGQEGCGAFFVMIAGEQKEGECLYSMGFLLHLLSRWLVYGMVSSITSVESLHHLPVNPV